MFGVRGLVPKSLQPRSKFLKSSEGSALETVKPRREKYGCPLDRVLTVTNLFNCPQMWEYRKSIVVVWIVFEFVVDKK